MLTQEELEKCENPYEEIEKMAKGLVEELQDREYNRGYENGMEDAWETFKKIYSPEGLSFYEIKHIFGENWNIVNMLKTFSPKEVKEKIDNYIKKKNAEFHVGDEIIVNDSDVKYVIVRSEGVVYNDSLYVVGDDGITSIFNKKEATKTGRHFDEVEELFKKMKED